MSENYQQIGTQQQPTARVIVCVLCGSQFSIHSHTRGDYSLCAHCYNRDTLREWDRLESVKRKLAHDALCSLSLVEWLHIAASWRGLCALCQEVGYSHIDMVEQQRGLVAHNVIPTCRACHIHLGGSWASALARVAAQLASVGVEA